MKRHFSMQWHITDRCDQRCKHCYIFAGKDKVLNELPLEKLLKTLDNFLLMCKKLDKLPNISLTGGDPLLHPDFWELAEILKQKNISFSILGNPFHLSEEVVKRLENLGCKSYQMSIDGLRETHDFLRKAGSFDATLNAYKFFENSSIKSAMMATVSTLNVNEIPHLVKIATDCKVNTFAFARYCPNPEDKDTMISPENYRDFLDKTWVEFEKYKDKGTNFALKDHLWKLYLYEKGIFKISKENPEYILDGCHAGITHITTLADGTIYACRRSETPVGNALNDSFYDVFMGEKMNEYRKYDEFEACKDCELKCYCRGCPSVAKCLTGNFYAKDPQCWKK